MKSQADKKKPSVSRFQRLLVSTPLSANNARRRYYDSKQSDLMWTKHNDDKAITIKERYPDWSEITTHHF